MNTLDKLLNGFIKGGERIGVAVSGGLDSVCLLDMLCQYKKVDFSLVVINLDHGIRGDESLRDSLFVKAEAEKRGLPLFFKALDVPTYAKENQLTIEQAGRELRYAFFNSLLGDKVDKIFTAHHKDDLCETVLMRIFRGTGVRGLSGILAERDGFCRPLLSVTRAELEEYARERGLEYITDSTNLSNDYSRNFIRNQLLPLVESRFPMYRDSISRLAKLALEDTLLLDSLAPRFVCDNKARLIAVNSLKEVDVRLAKRSVYNCLKSLGATTNFEEKHYQIIFPLLDASSGAGIDLAGGVRCEREKDNLVFYKVEEEVLDVYPFKVGETRWGDYILEIREYQKGDKIFFDLDKIPPTAIIRSRRDGDYVKKFGGGTRSLSDFYNDKKFPRRKRAITPLIAEESEVFVVCDFEISAKVKVGTESKKVYTATLKEINLGENK